jgi:hypothetical protein
MAARKSFLRVAQDSATFAQRVREAARGGVTEAQLEEQKVSFAYGNAPVDSKSTKDSVRESSKHNLLPA